MEHNIYYYIKTQGSKAIQVIQEHEKTYENFIKLYTNRNYKKIIIVGSGTSYNAGIYLSQLINKDLYIDSEVYYPMQFAYHYEVPSKSFEKDEILVVGISQSGTSHSTIEALKKAKKIGIDTLALTEDLDSLIVNTSDCVVRINCGKELIPIETRGYMITLVTMYLLVQRLRLTDELITPDVYGNNIEKLIGLFNKFDSYHSMSQKWVEDNLAKLLEIKHGHVTSYGNNLGTMHEAVLKLYETTRVLYSPYEIEELMHGPNIGFEGDTSIFVTAQKEEGIDRVEKFLKWNTEKRVTDSIFLISNDINIYRTGTSSLIFDVDTEFTPFIFVIPFQLIAAKVTDALGYPTSYVRESRKTYSHIREN